MSIATIAANYLYGKSYNQLFCDVVPIHLLRRELCSLQAKYCPALFKWHLFKNGLGDYRGSPLLPTALQVV
jgi:hypothetical protein